MKKIFFSLFCSIMLLAGCAEDFTQPLAPVSGDSVNARIELTANAVTSKAVADNDGFGASINQASIDICILDGAEYKPYKTVKLTTAPVEGKWAFTVKLIKNQTYRFVVWADNSESGYVFAGGVVTKSLEAAVNNTDKLDAFFANKTVVADEQTLASAIKLEAKRPFAQLNIISKGINKDFEPKSVDISYTAPTSFNIYEGTFGDPQTIKAEAVAPYYQTLAGYTAGNIEETSFYTLAMDYVFAGTERSMAKVDFKVNFNAAISHNFENIPLQRNYRTNVKGDLVNSDGKAEIEILPGWDTPEIECPVWDGTSQDVPEPETDEKIHITTPMELAGLAQAVNAGNKYEGKIIVLDADMDLDNCLWTPIGGEKSFAGTFDGQNHTISNLAISGNGQLGLFGWIENGTVKNLKVKNIKISSEKVASAGSVAGQIFNGGTVDNCSVENAEIKVNHYAGGVVGKGYGKITNCSADKVDILLTPDKNGASFDNGDKGGAIIGFSAADNYQAIEGNTATNFNIRGYRDMGGVAGAANAGYMKNNSASDGVITIDQTTNSYGDIAANAAPVLGRVLDGTLDESNVSTNVEIKGTGMLMVAADTYEIYDKAGLIKFAESVNEKGKTYEDCTVTLKSDVDLAGMEWKAIGGVVSYPSVTFSGVFDGEEHIVSNISCTDNTPNYAAAGFFGSAVGTIKNLTVKDICISSSHYAGGICGYSSSEVCKIINCKVIGGTITSTPELIGSEYDNGDKAGGILGYGVTGGVIEGCSVEGVTITAHRDLGGIVGACSSVVKDNSVKNSTIVQSDKNGYNSDVTTYGEIIGRDLGATLSGNTSENVTVKASSTVSTQEALAAAIASAPAGSDITISAPGTYSFTGTSNNITIKGTSDVVFNCTGSGSIAQFSNGATFEGITLNFGNNNYTGFQHSGAITMKGCTIKGLFFGYGDINFENCHFVQENAQYSMWTYGSEHLYFKDCTFDCAGKCINVYTENSEAIHYLTFDGCIFNSSVVNKPALAVKNGYSGGTSSPVHYDISMTGCKVNGFGQSDGDLQGFIESGDYKNAYGYNSATDPLQITIEGELKVNIE